ncbi:MAG: hypothetical protein HKP58_01975 [Desulfatitalea sp.]|nr:hypothetical protein [Desulfatitalea sp.]NNJ99156.1 hypothetical protein [Desulfatitalea sp.]
MKWSFPARLACVCLLALMYCPCQVTADEHHYRNMFIGGRAGGLAGAYTALSDDTAGCYYNPAGIAMAPSMSISASANTYQRSLKVYKNTLTGTDGKQFDWQQTSSSLLPNFFGVVKKAGPGWLGISYAVPDSTRRRQDQVFTNITSSLGANYVGQYVINIDDTDNTYLFGPSYALRFGQNVSLGTTVYVHYRHKQVIRNQLLQFNEGEHLWVNYYDNQEDWGIRPILGLIWEPVQPIALGLTVSQTHVFAKERREQTILRDTTSSVFADTNRVDLVTSDYHQGMDAPVQTTFGMAWFVSPRLLFSTDIAYNAPIEDKETVWNLSVGAEYYIWDNLALRIGIYTDRANTPDLNPNLTNQPEHIDIYGMNGGISLYHGHSSVTLGFSYGYGSGQAQVIADSTVIQDATIQNGALFLAASYGF